MAYDGNAGKPSLGVTSDTAERIENWVKLVEQGASKSKIDEAEEALANSLRIERFVLKQRLPFFQKMARSMKSGETSRRLRFAGKRLVVDKSIKDDDRGRNIADHKKTERGKRASGSRFSVGSLDRDVASGRVNRLMTSFEKLVFERFEKGKEIERFTKDGKPIFANKSEAEWKAFFKKFAHRSIMKKTKMEGIKEFILRGLVGKGEKGVFIGDMRLGAGRVEKFIRLSILAEIFAKLRGKKPGSILVKSDLGKMEEDLLYLAIGASRRERFAFNKKAAEGRFMDGRSEMRAAEALGLSVDSHLKEKAKRLRERKGGGGMSSMFDKDSEPDGIPYKFVPWWHWGNLSKPGKFRWFTLFFYVALFALVIIGAFTLTMKLSAG